MAEELCPACGVPMEMHGRVACDKGAAQRPKEPISTERLRNTRAWAEARVGQMSGADVIVGAIDELLERRAPIEQRTSNQKALEQQLLDAIDRLHPGTDNDNLRLMEAIACLVNASRRPADETSDG